MPQGNKPSSIQFIIRIFDNRAISMVTNQNPGASLSQGVQMDCASMSLASEKWAGTAPSKHKPCWIIDKTDSALYYLNEKLREWDNDVEVAKKVDCDDWMLRSCWLISTIYIQRFQP